MPIFSGNYFVFACRSAGSNAIVNNKPIAMSFSIPNPASYQSVDLSIDEANIIVSTNEEYQGIKGVYETDKFYLVTLKGMDSEFFKRACLLW
jgi:hypothetical protein